MKKSKICSTMQWGVVMGTVNPHFYAVRGRNEDKLINSIDRKKKYYDNQPINDRSRSKKKPKEKELSKLEQLEKVNKEAEEEIKRLLEGIGK